VKELLNSKIDLGLLKPLNHLLILVSLTFSSRKSQKKHFEKQGFHLHRT